MSDEELDYTPVVLGPYIGQTPTQIAEHDPLWLVQSAENYLGPFSSDTLLQKCREAL